jgi:hypothetical protein
MAALRPSLEEGLAGLTPDQMAAWAQTLQPLLASGLDQVVLFLDPFSTSAYRDNANGTLKDFGLFPESATAVRQLLGAAQQALREIQPEVQVLLCPPWARSHLVPSATPESAVVQGVSASLGSDWVFIWAGPDGDAAAVTAELFSEYENLTGCQRPIVWDRWKTGPWPAPYRPLLGPEVEERTPGVLLSEPMGTGLQRLYGWSAGWALWNPGSYEATVSEAQLLERVLGPGCGEDGTGFMKAAREVLGRIRYESPLPDVACLGAGTETWDELEALRVELSDRLNRLEAFSWNERFTSQMHALVVRYTGLLERCRLSVPDRIEALLAEGEWRQVLREQEYVRGSDLPPMAERRSELISGCAYAAGGDVLRAVELLTRPLLPGEEVLLAPLHETLTRSIISSLALLGAPDEIRALPRRAADGQFSLLERDDKWCFVTQPEAGSQAIYFDITESSQAGIDGDIRLAVELLDSGEGWVFVEYDSRFAEAPDPVYLRSGGYRLADSGEWKEVVFYLSAARFANRQAAGADLRLVCEEVPIHISSLRVLPQ